VARDAGGFVALLQESDAELQLLALQRLNELVDVFWAEIAEALPQLGACMMRRVSTWWTRTMIKLMGTKMRGLT
jgi:hypothetical protein